MEGYQKTPVAFWAIPFKLQIGCFVWLYDFMELRNVVFSNPGKDVCHYKITRYLLGKGHLYKMKGPRKNRKITSKENHKSDSNQI